MENCHLCQESTPIEDLCTFEHKGKGIEVEGVCDNCFQFLTKKHTTKKNVEEEKKLAPTLTKSALKKLSGGSRPNIEEDQHSTASGKSGVSVLSMSFTKWYCVDCQTRTGRFRFFRTNEAWIVHMMKDHKASLTYGEYLQMPHVMENFPHCETDVIVSKFGNLGVDDK